MTDKEFYETVINGLKNRGFTWDIFLRPFRIMYYKYKLRKLSSQQGVKMFEKEAEDKAFEKYPLPTGHKQIDFERNIKYEEGFKDGAEFGYNKANEWHKDGVPEITHKTCLALIDRLPNVILVFWNGEVWIDIRTLERYKKVNAWKYVDFPQE